MTELKHSYDNIRTFIADKIGCDENEITTSCDIVYDLGCCGDDFHELIENYAKEFNVKMDNYLWYFHTEEEGHFNSLGRIFFKAPPERVQHISVTPNLLLDSANEGKWILNYPEHSLPKKRYDILVNQIIVGLFIVFIIYKCAK